MEEMASGGPGGRLILVAEDSRTEAEGLRVLLEQEGYEVVWAADGRQALELARKRRPDVIISDIVMPELDGYGLCRSVKDDPRLSDVPVMLVTTLSEPSDVIKGLEAGADHFIRKPYRARYLLSRLNYLMANRALREDQRMQMGLELRLGGKTHFISAQRQQILDLLISTFEQAVDLNAELVRKQREVTQANLVLARLYGLARALNQAASTSEVVEVARRRLSEMPGVAAVDVAVRGGEGDAPDAGAGGPASAAGVPIRLPLVSRGQEVASISLTWTGGELDPATRARLAALADQVAVALDRATLYEGLERLVDERTAALTAEVEERQRQEARVARLNRYYSVLSQINTTIVRVRTRRELFERACATAVEKGGFAFAWIGTYAADGGALVPEASAGGDDRFRSLIDLGAAEPAGTGFAPGTAREVEPLVWDDTGAGRPEVPWSDAALALGCRSAVVLPLRSESRLVGAFTLFAAETGVFDDREMGLLTEIAADVSFALDYIRNEEKIRELAYFDSVSGLPNAAYLAEWLGSAHDPSEPGHHPPRTAPAGVVVVGLDRFQAINYSLGKDVGDELLRAVGERMREVAPFGAVVARLRGDKFALAVRGGDADAADAYARRLIAALSLPFTVGQHEDLFVGASAGVAVCGEADAGAEELVQRAEIAMYRARQDRPGGYLKHSAAISAEAEERHELENALRNAVAARELTLHYQPVVDLATRRLDAVEALVRWERPGVGPVSPARFIPLAEETGIITALGAWVIEAASAQARAWSEDGRTPPRVAINLSARQFHQPDLYEQVMETIARTGVDPRLLTFEITESHLMHDVEASRTVMARLVEKGLRFSLDDFGTGYSSLAYISGLPITSLKIDRSFVRDLGAGTKQRAIVEAMISMAKSLGLKVIAEGVETREQLEFLEALGCDAVQGYYFARPLPAADLDRYREGRLDPAAV